MERLVLKSFLNFLEDNEVVEYCETLSVLIEDDFKEVLSGIKSGGIKSTIPEVQRCIKYIKDVIETLLSFIYNMKALYYHGKNENRSSKDALALNDYAPLNKFVLGIKDLVKSVRTICSKFVVNCKKANETAWTVTNKYNKEVVRGTTVGGFGGVALLVSAAVGVGAGIGPLGFIITLALFGVGVGVGWNRETQTDIPELEKLFKCMSKIMEQVIISSSRLCDKLEQYYADIDFSYLNFKPMQGLLSNEDRSHIFITLDSVYHVCHYQYQQSVKWESKVSEIKKYL